jgi:hypothetical protein
MNWLSVVVVSATVVLPTASMSQQLYRCGNKYSQTPCDAEAKPARVPSGAAPDQAKRSHGKDLCLAEGPQKLGFSDLESTRISSVAKGAAEVIQYADQPIVAHKYVMTINTKDAYGAYIGERPYSCFLSEDEHRILKVELQRK